MEIGGKKMKRTNYLSWEEYFMGIARLTAMRSKDPSTQVGACIVDNENRILSVGYNGAPNGFEDEDFPWDREGEPLNTKYLYVCHAEMNAISNFRGSRKDLKDATIYVDLFPCNECAKHIIQSGIKHIVYLKEICKMHLSDEKEEVFDYVNSWSDIDLVNLFSMKTITEFDW
jgi:dCMP deaminase